MQFDYQLAGMARSAVKASAKKNEPVFIDFEVLSTILIKDLELRNIEQKLRMERAFKKILSKQLGMLDQHMKEKYRKMFETFLLSLIIEKKAPLSKAAKAAIYGSMSDRDRSFTKIVNERAAVTRPRKHIFEVNSPEQEQAMIRKPEGQLVATNASYELLQQLVDSYQSDEMNLNNKIARNLARLFREKLGQGIGQARLNQVVDTKQAYLEPRVIEWSSSSSDNSSMTDSDFEKLAGESHKKLPVKMATRGLSMISSDYSNKLNPDLVEKRKLAVEIEKLPQPRTVKILREPGCRRQFYKEAKYLINKGPGTTVGTKDSLKPTAEYLVKCIEQRIVPKPAFAKIEGRTFSQRDTYINKGMADALQAYFEHTKEEIRTVYLIRNGLKDDSLAKILSGLSKYQLEKLVLIGNEVGPQSVAVLQSFFNPSLKSLELCDLKIKDNLLESADIFGSNSLRSLTLKGINMSFPGSFERLRLFLQDANTALRELSITGAFLTQAQILKLLSLLN